GRVVVASILDDGTSAISTLQFGGNPSLPQETKSSLLEVSDEISRLTTAGGHRFKLGGLLNEQRSSVGFVPNRFGTFFFNSLSDFAAGTPPLTLRGGFGEFRGTAPAQLFASVLNSTGLNNGQALLTCVGAAAPTPDWASYLADPATIPTTCNGGTAFFANQRRNVTVFDPDFEAPRAWRASLGLNRRFWDRYSFSIDAGYARGVAQTGLTDINLDTVPKFSLSNEGNRPVYAPASAIIPTSGAVSILGSRVHPQFGTVNEVTSHLNSNT